MPPDCLDTLKNSCQKLGSAIVCLRNGFVRIFVAGHLLFRVVTRNWPVPDLDRSKNTSTMIRQYACTQNTDGVLSTKWSTDDVLSTTMVY